MNNATGFSPTTSLTAVCYFGSNPEQIILAQECMLNSSVCTNSKGI